MKEQGVAQLNSQHVWKPILARVGFVRFIAVGLTIAASVGSAKAVTAAEAPKLLPMPREYSSQGVIALAHGVSVKSGSDSEDRFAEQDISAWLQQLNIANAHGHSVVIELLRSESKRSAKLLSASGIKIDGPMHEEGYAIVPNGNGLAVIADSSP